MLDTREAVLDKQEEALLGAAIGWQALRDWELGRKGADATVKARTVVAAGDVMDLHWDEQQQVLKGRDRMRRRQWEADQARQRWGEDVEGQQARLAELAQRESRRASRESQRARKAKRNRAARYAQQ